MGRDRVLNPPESGFSHELPDNDKLTSDNRALSEVELSYGENIGLSAYLRFRLLYWNKALYKNAEMPNQGEI
jgi:hypothetical protein